MLYKSTVFAVLGSAYAQTTFTGCHNHTTSGINIEYCFGPDGSESALATFLAVASAATTPAANNATATATATYQTASITGCHSHSNSVFCINGAGSEVEVMVTATGELPAQYTGCHTHGSETYCLDPTGQEVALVSEVTTVDNASTEENTNCHFHAGVEHCSGAGEEEGEVDCGLREREYDIGLRVGTLFVVLSTSAIGVFFPILLQKLPVGKAGATGLLMVKQFGTGVIIATAFIHLYTHAELMFSNECIGELDFEGTTSAIVMAGLFLSFLVEYLGVRLVAWHLAKKTRGNTRHREQLDDSDTGTTQDQRLPETRNAFMTVDHHHGGANNKLSVMVMEAGILFHSILIGLTLVVAGDSFYRTLLVVIVFHQVFEGLALGARIALLPGAIVPWKFVMAFAFTLITPIGMAIGIGVLNSFNGNDPSTVITLGTLDALSAGILVWVGVVDMWARDWVIEGGEMLASGGPKTLGAGFSLICGMILMGVLGKWA